MSSPKVKEPSDNHVAEKGAVFNGKTKDELKVILENLLKQQKEYNVLVVKLQGGIEVVSSLIENES